MQVSLAGLCFSVTLSCIQVPCNVDRTSSAVISCLNVGIIMFCYDLSAYISVKSFILQHTDILYQSSNQTYYIICSLSSSEKSMCALVYGANSPVYLLG